MGISTDFIKSNVCWVFIKNYDFLNFEKNHKFSKIIERTILKVQIKAELHFTRLDGNFNNIQHFLFRILKKRVMIHLTRQ